VATRERLDSLRRLLPGSAPPATDERLLQLFWNRAELKKELGRLQDEHQELLERIKQHEGAAARSREQWDELERYLGDPEAAVHALVYFQLRALWRACALKVSRYAEQLRQQQQERERHRQLIEFDQARARRLAECDQRLADARAEAEALEVQLQTLRRQIAAQRGFWNYFRRHRLQESAAALHLTWDAAVTQVTDLSDDRLAFEHQLTPAFAGLSVQGRRNVNTAVIAYAQRLVELLSRDGLAVLALETKLKRVFDVRYGGREDCARLMSLLRGASIQVDNETGDSTALRQRIEELSAAASYRSETDTIAFIDSLGTLLVDDYWDVYRALLQ